ncbi:MAG: 16S rRNA (cytidine(1402)-2'-O)-methyltransferase [Candidatus Levybacteria bacterium]|nr:16S rRNA (cytidine(1402)-2'-O)-methyltransferase [Candidatus Levybacteria bacterium]
MMGILYIVATPLGNLDDITIRAIKTLFSVDGIACEDTRKAGFLLRELQKRYPELAKPANGEKFQRMLSYYEENENKRIPEVITALKNGLSIALVSDAGTPTISDPGFRLVRECVKEGIPVESIPGPSAGVLALSLSGLPTDKFLFLGYPPRKAGNRMRFFENAKKSQESFVSTIIFYEAPHRIVATLNELASVFGDIDIVVARELTKMHQEVRREKIKDAIVHFSKHAPRGEFVLLLHPTSEE